MALLNKWPMQDNAASTTVVETVAGNNASTLSTNTSVATTTGPGGLYPRAIDVAGLTARSMRVASVAVGSTPTITLAGWVRFTAVTPPQIVVELSTDYNAAAAGGICAIDSVFSGQMITLVRKGGAGTNYNGKAYTLAPVTNTWIHLCLQWDFTQAGGAPAKEALLRINGSEPTVANDTTNVSNNTGNFSALPLFFGARNRTSFPTSAAFAGWHLYDHILSASEIAALIAEVTPARRRRAAQASIRSTF